MPVLFVPPPIDGCARQLTVITCATQGDIVECLFPFTGQTRQGRKRRVEEDIVYPRMLELAAK
jgi:hypothetical protein